MELGNNMKLCLIAPVPPPYGGVANWEVIVEEEIRKHKDIDLTLINIAANKRPLDGRNIFDRIFYSGYVLIRTYIKLRREVRKHHPDVVHMTTSGGLGFYRDILLLKYLKDRKIPSVYHIHFGRSVKYRAKSGWHWQKLKRAVSLADTTVVIDDKSYKILKKYANKIVEINNPINIKNMDKYRNRKSKKIIIFIGWVIKTKGVEELVQAFDEFNTHHNKEYKLFLVGPGEIGYIKKLKKKAGENVFFIGEVEHEIAMMLLAMSEIMMLPSYTEGFPNVVLEAMALGKCVIASDVGAIPYILSDGTGIIIKPKSVKEIKDALEKASDDELRKNIGSRAYQRVVLDFDIGSTYEKYKEVWKENKI